MRLIRKIDLKHGITDDHRIVKIKDDEIIAPVPDNEPLILFRARDRLAVPLLEHYRQLCVADGCNDFQLGQINELIAKFQQFSADNPQTMKQPGITRGL